MIGILVHGDNHFIVDGAKPDRETALALARHWSLIEIGAVTPEPLRAWRVISKAFRENLEWAIVVEGESGPSAAVAVLLQELEARGVAACHVNAAVENQLRSDFRSETC